MMIDWAIINSLRFFSPYFYLLSLVFIMITSSKRSIDILTSACFYLCVLLYLDMMHLVVVVVIIPVIPDNGRRDK